MPKIESEKIDGLHRPCSRPAPRGKIKSVRTHSEVIERFDSFSLLKLLFLVRNWHCWSRKAFTRQMTPQIREETAKTAVFRQRWQAWKVVRSIAAVRQRPRTPPNWRCSFAFFESFLWHFNKKQHAEVIFRLSRPVLCKNQENGSGKQWSLHAPLNRQRPHVRSAPTPMVERSRRGVDVLRAVLEQIPPLTFGNWPLPYKEKITWYVYILPEMTSYVYSGHDILPPRVHHVYITWTSHVYDRSRQNEVKGHMRAKYSIFTLSLQVQNELAPPAKTGVFITSVFTLFPDKSWTVSKQTLHRGEGIKWAVSPNRCHFEAVLA